MTPNSPDSSKSAAGADFVTSNPSVTHGARGLARLVELARQSPLNLGCEDFYFLRHGQTPRNAQRIFQSYDEPLSELGERQAAAAAQILSRQPIATIQCSDARRALNTAQTVGASLNLQPEPHAELRERNFGALVGTSSASIDWDCAPEGGETLEQFVARTRRALATVLAVPAQPVLVVAHGGTLYVLAALLNAPIDGSVLANAQPLHFVRRDSAWCVQPLAPGDLIQGSPGAMA